MQVEYGSGLRELFDPATKEQIEDKTGDFLRQMMDEGAIERRDDFIERITLYRKPPITRNGRSFKPARPSADRGR